MTAVMTTVISNRRVTRDELRSRIYQSAIDLFRRRGYAESSVDDIVALAAVAKGTFYNFFASKIDVLKSYYLQIDQEIAARRAKMNPSVPKSELLAYARDVETVLRREGALMRELLEATLNEPEMRRIDAASGRSDISDFAEFLATAQNSGAIRSIVDCNWAAALVVDSWSGAMRDWLQSEESSALVDHFAPRIHVLFLGIEEPQ